MARDSFSEATMERILNAMPATSKELSDKAELNPSTVRRYLSFLHPNYCHICGHQPNPANLFCMPAAIYAKGQGVDAKYVKIDNTKELKERNKARQVAYRIEKKKKKAVQADDSTDEKILLKLRKIAQNNVTRALLKPNTPFGPLFELGE